MLSLKEILKHFLNIFIANNEIKNSSGFINQGIHNEIHDNIFIDISTIIGNYNYIGNNTSISKAVVGNFCSIATNVSIGMGEHLTDSISTSSLFYKNPLDILLAKECKIGNDVWIGVDAIILRGVKIGNGAIIGANSVVTKDIPNFAIVIGSPARILRYRFTNEEISEIELSNWWNEIDLNLAKEKVRLLTIKLNKTKVF